MADSDDGSQSKRDSHYNQQRSSLRSDQSTRTPTTSRPASSHLLQDFTLTDDVSDLNYAPSPSPVIPRRKQSLEKGKRRRVGSAASGSRGSGAGSRATTSDRRTESRGRTIDSYLLPDDYENLNELVAPPPIENRRERRFWRHSTLEEEREASREVSRATKRSRRSSHRSSPFQSRRNTTGTFGTDLDITALPPIHDGEQTQKSSSNEYMDSKTPAQRRRSRLATELYTISYLIFFSILGTLARLGMQWLTFYPGAPSTFPVLWANFAGTLVMGFLTEDRRLFRQEWGNKPPAPDSNQITTSDEEKGLEMTPEAKESHAKVKKTIPLYIGLATGFCGSFTSFSSFMRDIFFSLSNDLPSPINHPSLTGPSPATTTTVPRHNGYSVEAVLAVIIITIASCYAALKIGAHLAIYTERMIPILPFRIFRRIIDPVMVFVALGCWLGAIFMSRWPPDRPGGPNSHGTWVNETWRGQALFACVFAPVGCILRFYASLKLNGLAPSFPLGTFAVNVFGTAVLGMAFDLQHVDIAGSGLVGGGRVSCQVLQGIMDGFCGTLTTVSTWIVELHSLRRSHSYFYGLASVAAGLGILVAIMGGVRWSVGWSTPMCVT